MGGFKDKNGSLHADSVPLADVAEQFGTPCYAYSYDRITDNVTHMQRAFEEALPAGSRPLIAFAAKTNSNMAVLRIMANLGLGADVVTGGELIRCLQAGMPADKIVFSGVGKTDEELQVALDHDIFQINVESRPEMERIAVLAGQAGKKPKVAIRVNPNVEAGTHAKITTGKSDNKFGLSQDATADLYAWTAGQDHIDIRGLSVHIGSQLTALDPFRLAFEKLAALSRTLKDNGLPLHTIDLGGGLGIRYRDETPPSFTEYAEMIRDIVAPLGAQIILEPGRVLIGDTGVLLSRVTYVKETPQRKYAILDAGMNDMIRPALYDAYHDIRPVTPRAGEDIYDIVGPVCETADTFGKARTIPHVETGDLMAIMDTGGMGFTMASNYNTRPLPAEVLIRDGNAILVRKRQDIQDILKEDIIPDD